MLSDLTHNHTQIAHVRTHIQRDILAAVVVVVVVGIFFFVFFFSYSHYKREGQGPVELTKELTNITKILQFVNISSTLSAFINRGGDPGFVGRVGESERCQLGLWNRFFCLFPSPPKLNDNLLLKYCFLGFTHPLRVSQSPFLPRLWGEAIVHNDFLQTASPPQAFPLFTL